MSLHVEAEEWILREGGTVNPAAMQETTCSLANTIEKDVTAISLLSQKQPSGSQLQLGVLEDTESRVFLCRWALAIKQNWPKQKQSLQWAFRQGALGLIQLSSCHANHFWQSSAVKLRLYLKYSALLSLSTGCWHSCLQRLTEISQSQALNSTNW